jgi:hypothetical protein
LDSLLAVFAALGGDAFVTSCWLREGNASAASVQFTPRCTEIGRLRPVKSHDVGAHVGTESSEKTISMMAICARTPR